MAINIRSWPSLEIVGYPDYAASGATTFTFNSGATQAQVEADASLFNNWASLAASAVVRNGPVTVVFESNCTITETTTFPAGSRFIGVGSVFPQIISGAGIQTNNIEYFQYLELVCSPAGNAASFGESAWVSFYDVEFNVTNPGTAVSLVQAGAGLTLDHCFGAGGSDIGVGAAVFFLSGANAYSIDLQNGTVLAPAAIATEPGQAGQLELTISPGSTSSGYQANVDAAFAGIASQLGGGLIFPDGNVDEVTGIGGDVVWPAGAPFPTRESNTAILGLSAASSGHNVTIGNASGGAIPGFSQGQILHVLNFTPGAAHTLNLLQPNGATPIPIGAGTNALVRGDTATAGQARGVTLMAVRPFDTGKTWECINTFVVPA